MFKAAVFDLDGTLLDTLESIAVNANGALAACGLKTHDIDDYRMFAGDGQVMLLKRALAASGDPEAVHFDEVSAQYRRRFREGCSYHVKPYDGVRETLDELKGLGVRIAVVSNKNHENTIKALDDAFGSGYFDFALGKKDGVRLKPDPQPLNMALEALGLSSGQCLYAGDTITDMLAGKNAGLFTVGVCWGFRDRAELESGNPAAIIERPDQLVAFFK